MERISKNKYYFEIASKVALRSTCLRRAYGAVLVKNDEIIATGYNGSARGEENCCDTGKCWRQENNIPAGERYEECVAVHAEPCKLCRRMLKNAGIKRYYNQVSWHDI